MHFPIMCHTSAAIDCYLDNIANGIEIAYDFRKKWSEQIWDNNNFF